LDASAMVGSIGITWAAGALVQSNIADAISIKGGAGTKDAVSVSYASDTAENTGTFTMSGVETLNVASTFTTTLTAADVIDLTNVTGLSKIILSTGATNANSVTVSKLSTATSVQLGFAPAAGSEFLGVTAKLDLADATGTTDSLSVSLFDTHAGAATATIQTDGVETLNLTLNDSTEVHKVVFANTNTNNAKLVVTSANAAADLTVTTLAAAYTTVDASASKSAFIMADSSRAGTVAMTITTGADDDTIIMKHANDVINAGGNPTSTPAGDTLKVVSNLVLGGLLIDLTSTVDQITTFNGSGNAAVQVGFENVDLSGITGTPGADITGTDTANAITGTKNADVIKAGKGIDIITVATAGGADSDDIDGGEGTTDELIFAAGANALTGDTTLVNIEKITLGTTADVNLTNQTEAFNVIGGTGINTIETGSGDDTITGGDGIDTIDLTNGGVDTVVFGSTAALSDNDGISGFTVGSAGDKLNFEAFLTTASTAVSLNGATSPAITEYAAASAGAVDISNKIALFTDAGTALTAANVLAEFAAGAAFGTATTSAVVLSGTAGTAGAVLIWYTDIALGTSATTWDTGDVVLVGTIAAIDIANLTVANFVVA
jgi:hypothetical protein